MKPSYTVLVADDEPMLLKYVTEKIGSFGDRYKVCASAENGEVAFEAAVRTRPDILLIDIRMPVLDGLLLAKKLQEAGLTPQIIIMSGYDDFSYAKESMRLGVREYLLKPLTAEALSNALQRAADEVDKAKAFERERLKLLLDTPETATMTDDCTYCLFLLRFPSGSDCKSESAETLIQRMEPPPLCAWLLPEKRENETMLLLRYCTIAGCPADIAGQLVARAEAGDSLLVAVWPEPLPLPALGAAAKELREVLRACAPIWGGGVLLANETRPDYAVPEFSRFDENMILADVLSGRQQTFREHLYGIFSEWSTAKLPERVFTQLVIRVTDVCLSANRRAGTDMRANINARITDMLCESESSPAFFEAYCDFLSGFIFRTGDAANQQSAIISRVHDYLNGNYMRATSLGMIAKEFNIDPAVLTRKFAAHYGTTPLKYMIRLRLNAAKRLLVSRQELSVRSIGQMVGYPDPFHFSKTFKKETGVSPSEYRARNAKDKNADRK